MGEGRRAGEGWGGGVGKNKRRKRIEGGREGGKGVGGEGDVRTQQQQQSHQVMDALTDKQHSGRDRQTSRGCNAERAQTIPDCACVCAKKREKPGTRMCVRACVRLH